MSLAVAFAFEARIQVVLIDGLPVQIGQPRLDVSSGDEDRHALMRSTPFRARLDTGILNLLDSRSDLLPVRVDHDDQCLLDPVLPRPVVGKLLRESLPHELFPRPAASRADLDPLYPHIPARECQEPSGERLVLSILTHDDHLNSPAHCSHPLAMSSDSFSVP